MSIAPRPPIPELIPESAPFTLEQRTWLNGFFAGLLSLDGAGIKPLSAAESAALMPSLPGMVAPTGNGDGDDGEAPWHDQTLPLPERMNLAQGRPLRRRMMAAMAQQDCGQCGYNCQDYSEALFSKKEARLNLCVPGGKETARMLKTLHQELDSAAPVATMSATTVADATAAPAVAPGCSRDNPAEATFLSRTLLNKKGSAKETWHIWATASTTPSAMPSASFRPTILRWRMR
jgi:sulfite reductase (NADPH) flavoprotein alpha-component